MSSHNEQQLASDANILSTTDLKSKIQYVNPDFEKISGYSMDELVGEKHNIIRHPDMPSAALHRYVATPFRTKILDGGGEEPL